MHRELLSKDFWLELPEPLLRRLQTLNRRLLPHEIDALIEQLCAWRPLGLRQLSTALNRSPVYLQNTALKRLLSQKRLLFLYPEEPNHPRQAYQTPSAHIASSDSSNFAIGIND